MLKMSYVYYKTTNNSKPFLSIYSAPAILNFL